jgi:hypothetical protein
MKLHETEESWFDSQQEKEIILFPKASRSALGPTQPHIQRIFSRGVKRPGREADHSPPPSADDKNDWIYTSTAPLCPCGVQMDNFFFPYCMGLEHLIFTAQDSGKSVKMVPSTFRRKFMQKSCFSVTYNEKISRDVNVFYHFVNVQDSAKSVKMVTPTFRKKLCNNHAFPSRAIKSNKVFPNVDIIYYFVTVHVSAKSVKMVTTTFRSKFL